MQYPWRPLEAIKKAEVSKYPNRQKKIELNRNVILFFQKENGTYPEITEKLANRA